jgi:hypothetical protein
MPKTKQQKRREALERREGDAKKWSEQLAMRQRENTAQGIRSDAGTDDLVAKCSRAEYDVKRLRLALGITAS